MKIRTLFRVVDCIKSTYDMQNEKEHLYHYNEFLQVLFSEKTFCKNVYALLVFGILKKNIFIFDRLE